MTYAEAVKYTELAFRDNLAPSSYKEALAVLRRAEPVLEAVERAMVIKKISIGTLSTTVTREGFDGESDRAILREALAYRSAK